MLKSILLKAQHYAWAILADEMTIRRCSLELDDLSQKFHPIFKKYGAPIKLKTKTNQNIALFHFGKGVAVPDIAWEADIVICCHPECLPQELRIKHVTPDWRGVLTHYMSEGKLILSTKV